MIKNWTEDDETALHDRAIDAALAVLTGSKLVRLDMARMPQTFGHPLDDLLFDLFDVLTDLATVSDVRSTCFDAIEHLAVGNVEKATADLEVLDELWQKIGR